MYIWLKRIGGGALVIAGVLLFVRHLRQLLDWPHLYPDLGRLGVGNLLLFGLTLLFVAFAWIAGAYGIREPDGARSTEIPPAEIDLVLCPCTAFDGAGNRLGMGGGYYDRFLPRCEKAAVVSVAFEVQRAAKIPMDRYDRGVDAVITEQALIRPAAE